MDRRLVIGISLGAIVGVIILVLGYIFLFQKGTAPSPVFDAFKAFFPYGNEEPLSGTQGEIPSDNFSPSDSTSPLPKLRLISEEPVAGFALYDRKATSTATSTIIETAIRFIDKGTGHIHETSDRSAETVKISSNTLPRIHEVLFANKDTFVARRLDNEDQVIETFVGTLSPISATSSQEFAVKGSFLPEGISSVALFGNRFMTFYSSSGGMSGYLSSPIGSKELKVFSSPLSGWLTEWVGENNILFTSKPSSSYPGNLFLFNLANRSFVQILGPINGLTVKTDSSANTILYSESSRSSLNTFIKNRRDNSLLQLGIRTLPEKCLWSKKMEVIYCAVPESLPSGKYPDDWYKGLIPFADNIVKIDLETLREEKIVSLRQESGRVIDAINLSLNDRETHLYFINKNDFGLWSYEL